MYNYKYKYYYFTDQVNDEIKKKILNFKKINIIFYNFINNQINKLNLEKYNLIYKFCKKNKIPLYLTNDEKNLFKLKADGVFITSKYKKNIFNKNRIIIGLAHNQREYYLKKKQGCKLIMLSPLFFNPKYSSNKILNPVKFNLITKNWKTKICALGGVNLTNINKIKLLNNCDSVAFIRWKDKR